MRERTLSAVLLLALSTPAQVPPLPTARLEGRVVDPQQRPVPGAQVTVEVDGEVRGRTQTDASGTFVFGRLPQQVVVVRATTTAPDVGGNWVDLLGLRRGFVQVTTLPARKVTGTVRDDAGQPVAAAWVLAAPNDAVEFGFASCVAQSDANGHYELPQVPFGAVLLRAWAEGYDAFEGELDGVTDAQRDCQVLRDASQEHHFALREASAEQVAAADLFVTASRRGVPVPLPPPLRRVRADAEGSWRIRGWPYGDDVHVHAVVPGALVTPCQLFAGRGGGAGCFYVNDLSECVRGQLVGLADARLGDLTVLIQPLTGGIDVRRTIGRTRADDTFTIECPVDRDERFALRVVDGDLTVAAADPNRGWYLGKHGSEVHAVRVEPARTIRLRTVVGKGDAVAGARVAVFCAHQQPERVEGLHEPTFASGGAIAFGTTDLEGRVEITGLRIAAGERLVCVVTSALGIGERAFAMPPLGPAELGELPLDPAAEAFGQLVGDQGIVRAGDRVLVIPARRLLRDRAVVPTDREGRFRLVGQLPGHYTFLYTRDGQSPQEQDLQVGSNEVNLQ